MEVINNTTDAMQVSKADLTKMVEEGKKKNEIAAIYGLNNAQTTKMLKQAGLTIRKFHKSVFVLVD